MQHKKVDGTLENLASFLSDVLIEITKDPDIEFILIAQSQNGKNLLLSDMGDRKRFMKTVEILNAIAENPMTLEAMRGCQIRKAMHDAEGVTKQ
jgi:hypothetical protein